MGKVEALIAAPEILVVPRTTAPSLWFERMMRLRRPNKSPTIKAVDVISMTTCHCEKDVHVQGLFEPGESISAYCTPVRFQRNSPHNRHHRRLERRSEYLLAHCSIERLGKPEKHQNSRVNNFYIKTVTYFAWLVAFWWCVRVFSGEHEAYQAKDTINTCTVTDLALMLRGVHSAHLHTATHDL